MSKKSKLTQQERIMKLLLQGKKITQAQARSYNILSCSSRINELRRDGVLIDSIPYKNKSGRTVVQYQLTN